MAAQEWKPAGQTKSETGPPVGDAAGLLQEHLAGLFQKRPTRVAIRNIASIEVHARPGREHDLTPSHDDPYINSSDACVAEKYFT
ncbi:hypothetical protein Q8W71_30870 [Methylobacterium sp. NEAU 140]|uniref:hypothetical protein n=1 Tax=Methylobacterium sp. NEAU 140 TaxID=3064945 RepID=UPI0027366F5A|nr:hypothetical protein [Methylobacterium sp. NEAU 140]MDP4026995.1 hypothetical protein [Methylobacterium sp. NEAU 140]